MSYQDVMGRVEEAARRSGRSAQDVRVVVVSKGREVDEIRHLHELGHRPDHLHIPVEGVQRILQRT